MLDLLCRRYPNRRPSDFLDIDDEMVALQLDYAIALKYSHQEKEYDFNKTESTNSILKAIGEHGHGITFKPKDQSLEDKMVKDGLPIDVALKMFGGKGFEIKGLDKT